MKKILLSILILFLFGNTEAQRRFTNLNYKNLDETPYTTIDDPALLKQAQGTWVFDEKYRNMWYKVVINGNIITTYHGYPEKGRWNDERESRNEIRNLIIVNCHKIKTNGRYSWDGKPYTLSFSVIETDYMEINRMGPSFRISEGKLLQYGRAEFLGDGIISTNNGKIITEPDVTYRKVQSNYSPWKEQASETASTQPSDTKTQKQTQQQPPVSSTTEQQSQQTQIDKVNAGNPLNSKLDQKIPLSEYLKPTQNPLNMPESGCNIYYYSNKEGSFVRITNPFKGYIKNKNLYGINNQLIGELKEDQFYYYLEYPDGSKLKRIYGKKIDYFSPRLRLKIFDIGFFDMDKKFPEEDSESYALDASSSPGCMISALGEFYKRNVKSSLEASISKAEVQTTSIILDSNNKPSAKSTEKQISPEQPKNPDRPKLTFRKCEGTYTPGCINTDAIAQVQRCLDLVSLRYPRGSGFFDYELQDKLSSMGFKNGFSDSDIGAICDASSDNIKPFQTQENENSNQQTEKQKSTQQTQNPNGSKLTFKECKGIYTLGCYNTDAIAQVQRCFGLMTDENPRGSGHFDDALQKKLSALGFENGFTDADVEKICDMNSLKSYESLKKMEGKNRYDIIPKTPKTQNNTTSNEYPQIYNPNNSNSKITDTWITKGVTKFQMLNPSTRNWEEIVILEPDLSIKIKNNKDVLIDDLEIMSYIAGKNVAGYYKALQFENAIQETTTSKSAQRFVGNIELLDNNNMPSEKSKTAVYFFYGNDNNLGCIEIQSYLCKCKARIFVDNFKEGLEFINY